MLIRYLKTVTLKKTTPIKQINGTYKDSYEIIDEYKVMEQNLTDEVDAQVYGADINKIIRIKSPNGDLESYLYERLNNKTDNVSKYVIETNNANYKIVAVTLYKIDISRISGIPSEITL